MNRLTTPAFTVLSETATGADTTGHPLGRGGSTFSALTYAVHLVPVPLGPQAWWPRTRTVRAATVRAAGAAISEGAPA